MKRNFAFLAILFLGSVPVLAQKQPPQTAAKAEERFENPLLEDVLQMTRAELPESSILSFVRSRSSRLDADVTARDLIRLHRAGVSDRVIAYIARITGIEDRSSREDRDRFSDRDRDRDRDREPEMDRDRGRDRDRESDNDRDGVVAYDGPRNRDDSEDGEVEAYARPYGSVYDSFPGWWGYPYGWESSPYWGTGIVLRGGGRFHGGHGRDRNWGRDGNSGGGHRARGPSGDGAGRSRGESHGGGSHGGASHGGGHHGGGGRH